ncbi:MAG: ethanolamine ammonia-lyase subunit EutC [Trichloromonadaceae bacterium]
MKELSQGPQTVHPDPWQELRRHTAARIALGRCGVSMPTARQLEFQLAHARARDAVQLPFEPQQLERQLAELGLATLALHSAATDRQQYLQRPDFGRRLAAQSSQRLQQGQHGAADYDLALVVADGLSALAVHSHAVALISAFLPLARARGWRLAPVSVVTLGRVAIGDQIASLLGARAVAILLGERPGLSSPDSLGVYLTYQPAPGTTDERRNCISNIRPAGLLPAIAAQKLCYLAGEALRRQLSGVVLKDELSLSALAETMRSLLAVTLESAAVGTRDRGQQLSPGTSEVEP